MRAACIRDLTNHVLRVSDLECGKDVDYAQCSTPQVAALALQALKAPLACEVGDINGVHCSTAYVAARAPQALEALRSSTDLSIKVLILASSSPHCKYNSIAQQDICNIPKRYQHP